MSRCLLLLLLLQSATVLTEIAREDFDGDGRKESVYLQRLGASPLVSVQDIMTGAPVLHDVRFLSSEQGKLDTIGTVYGIEFPVASVVLKFRRARDKDTKQSILISDGPLKRHFVIYRMGTPWQMEEVNATVFKALSIWLHGKPSVHKN